MEKWWNFLQFHVYALCKRSPYQATTREYQMKKSSKFLQFFVEVQNEFVRIYCVKWFLIMLRPEIMEEGSNFLQFRVYVLCERNSCQAITRNYKTKEGSNFLQFYEYVVCEMTPYHATTWNYKTEAGSNFIRFCEFVLCEKPPYHATTWKCETEQASNFL